MKVRIPEGQHHGWPPIWGIHFKPWMERDVVFDSTAAYELPEEDQEDVNKLFGFGYFKGGHHKDSARFGWNYNPLNGRVRLYAYCYVDGERIIEELCEIRLHIKVRLLISIYETKRYVFSVHDGFNNWREIGTTEIQFNHDKKWKYKLGCFFGGNNPSPHDMIIKISKK
jgi:hypothetical protein